MAELAREWSTNSGCRVNDNQAVQSAISAGPLFEECRSLFNSSSSPLRLCFHRLNPTPFMNMCLVEANQQGGQPGSQPGQSISQKLGLCSVSAAYIEACEEQGVGLDLPSQCSKKSLALSGSASST